MARSSVSAIIPSADGSREGNVDLLLRDLEAQTVRPLEVLVVKGVSPNGLARNTGARRASGQVLVFLDDDVRLGHKRVLESMVDVLEDQRIGLVGAAQLLPPDSTAFQRAAARQIPRSQSSTVDEITDSDMVTTQCCAIHGTVFWKIGGFNEHIPRGVDPELRHRIRRGGWRIVVAPGAKYSHPMPANLQAVCRMYYRNGRYSAEAVWRMPAAALENPDGHVAEFVPYRSRLYRAGRHVRRLFLGLLQLHYIGVVSQIAYLSGYLLRWVQLRWSQAQLAARHQGETSER